MSEPQIEERIEAITSTVATVQQQLDQLSIDFTTVRNRMNNILIRFEQFEKQQQEKPKAKKRRIK